MCSSTLWAQGNFNYSVYNIDDKDNTTAWVEGKHLYGINEQVLFTSSIELKHSTLVMQNSRVKKIRISSGLGEGFYGVENNNDLDSSIIDRNVDVEFTISDTPEMKYIIFDTPIEANTLVLTILEVYEGSKYKDTAISEVVFFVNQDVNVSDHHTDQ